MMELDEAIKHCKEKAKELREQPFKEKMDIEDIASCEECAEEHEQLAEWLTDYKRLKNIEKRPTSKMTKRPRNPKRKPKCTNFSNCGDCVHAELVWEGVTFRGIRCLKGCK